MLTDTFKQLDTLLTAHRRWWQFQPFHSLDSRWRELSPSLHEALSTMDSPTLHSLIQDQTARVNFLAPWIPAAAELDALCKLPLLASKPVPDEHQLAHRVSGRKWQQITAFASQVPPRQDILEWCAGKGHLGRLLAARGAARVNSLELESSLCTAGQTLARRAGVNMSFHHCDVLTAELDDHLQPQTHCVALHACGQLHMHLLQQLVQRNVRAVSLSPCCYYLIEADRYRPMSQLASSTELVLDKSDLHIPLRETVTGGARSHRQRAQELRWRLAFDCLQRELREIDQYLPLATIPRHLLSDGFADFVAWALNQKGLRLKADHTLQKYLDLAEQRLPAVQQMELVQQLFQRPLELWLALDRALFLAENNYQVTLGEFCAREITPRNIFIQAISKDAT